MVEVCVKQSMNMPCACTGTGTTSRVRGCRGTFRLRPLASKHTVGSVGKNMWSARRRTSARRMCKACTLLMWYWRTVTCRPSFRLSQTKHIGSAYSWNAIRNFWCSGTSWTTLFWYFRDKAKKNRPRKRDVQGYLWFTSISWYLIRMSKRVLLLIFSFVSQPWFHR
jgi:hypothetical protein